MKKLIFALVISSSVVGPVTSAFAWGCVAVANSGAYGYSYNYDDRDDAVERALEECSARGRGCRIVDCDEDK